MIYIYDIYDIYVCICIYTFIICVYKYIVIYMDYICLDGVNNMCVFFLFSPQQSIHVNKP